MVTSAAETTAIRCDLLRTRKAMRLLILGATGKTGSELVAQGLQRGFEITALVRSPRKIASNNDQLKIVTGSPLDEGFLTRVLTGTDAVLSALGHTDLKPSDLVTAAARALVTTMKSTEVHRLLILSSTLVAPGGSLLTTIPRLLTRHALQDSAEMEKVVAPTDLAWTIVRLVRLTNKTETTPYRIFENEPPSVSASISRKTVAACMLNLVSDSSYFQKIIGIRAGQ
jgi:putative NADH-flavin reductase